MRQWANSRKKDRPVSLYNYPKFAINLNISRPPIFHPTYIICYKSIIGSFIITTDIFGNVHVCLREESTFHSCGKHWKVNYTIRRMISERTLSQVEHVVSAIFIKTNKNIIGNFHRNMYIRACSKKFKWSSLYETNGENCCTIIEQRWTIMAYRSTRRRRRDRVGRHVRVKLPRRPSVVRIYLSSCMPPKPLRFRVDRDGARDFSAPNAFSRVFVQLV